MKIERLHITIFLSTAALIWAIVLVCQGTPIGVEHARPFSIVVSVLVGMGLLFEFVFWHISIFHGWLFKRPDLRGTWKVEIQSSYVNPETNERVPSILCYMGVKQTLSTLNMHLMTPESESWLIADHVRISPNGHGYQIIGVYTNEPNVHLRDERISEMHQGAMVIETHGSNIRPIALTAKYWTDRKTTGMMEITNRIDYIATRFKDAQAVFENQESNEK